MDNGKRTVGLQKSKSFDEQDILRPGMVKPRVRIPGLVEGPRSKDPRYHNYINRYPVQDDRLPRLYPRPKEPMPILSSSVAAYFESTKNLCSGDASIPNRDCRVTRPNNANIVRADPNLDQRFGIGPPPPMVSRPKAPHTDTRNPEPLSQRVNREQRFEIGEPPPIVQKVKTTFANLHNQQLPEAGKPNAFYTDDATFEDQSKLEEAVRLKRQQMAEATIGLHVSPMPEVLAHEERRRLNKLRKKEELRLQMESNPHLARRERMKIFEEKRAQALARIQAKVTERERVEAEARKVAEEDHRQELEDKQRSAEKKQRRGHALERARMNREQQRVQAEQASLVEEAKRRAGCEERLRAAEAARIKALEEARRKADEMELKHKDKPIVIQESNHCNLKKIDSKFLQEDRDEMELLEYQLRRDREIVEHAERLQKATLNENDLRRRISEEDTKKQRAELRKATKSKSLPTLGPKRDQVKDKGRPIWGGNQSRTEYKKMSDRDPNYLRRLQQRKEVKKKSSIPVPAVLSRQLTFTVANHEPDPLQTGTPFVLTYQPNPEPRRIVMVHKSTSPRNPIQLTSIPDFYIQPNQPHVIDTYENESCTFKHDSPYMTLTERINVLRSNFLQEYIHNQNPNTKTCNYHEPPPILRQNFIKGQNQAFNLPIRRSQAFYQQVSYDEPVHQIHGTVRGQYQMPEIPSVRAFQDYSIPRRPATTQNEVAERDDLIRYLLNRQRHESTNTSDESRVPMICYTIQLPSKYARISRSLGFRAIVRP